MEFKIDTKATYTHITPLYGAVDAIMAASLAEKQTELAVVSGQNFLIDLSNCQNADKEGIEGLLQLHEICYAGGQSLVFTHVTEAVLKILKDQEADMALNITPTDIEAIDIISMEILERDLFSEES